MSKPRRMTIDTNINSYIENQLKPLYKALQDYQKEINKASILQELGLDKDMVLQKVNNNIDNELRSIDKVLYAVNNRVDSVIQKDYELAQELNNYYEELIS